MFIGDIYVHCLLFSFYFQTGLEKTLHQKVLSLQDSIAPQPVRQHAPEDDSGLLHELTQVRFLSSYIEINHLVRKDMDVYEQERIFSITN